MTVQSSDYPPTTEAAFARLRTVKHPSIDDLKLVVLLEAAGQGFYEGLAEAAPNEAIKRVFQKNGREETGHAHRVRRVIKLLFDEDVPMPSNESNPFCKVPATKPVVNRETLDAIVKGELDSDVWYQGWADGIANEEAARLLRQNGKEEAGHSVRVKEAIELLDS